MLIIVADSIVELVVTYRVYLLILAIFYKNLPKSQKLGKFTSELVSAKQDLVSKSRIFFGRLYGVGDFHPLIKSLTQHHR